MSAVDEVMDKLKSMTLLEAAELVKAIEETRVSARPERRCAIGVPSGWSKHQSCLGHVLCDNESFLTAPQSRAEYKKLGVRLWPIPPRSPGLNPVEKIWS